MAEVLARALLAELLYREFALLEIVREADKNVEANQGNGLSISDCGFKLERVIGSPVGQSELYSRTKRLCAQGFLVAVPTGRGRKVVHLSDGGKQVFVALEAIAEALK